MTNYKVKGLSRLQGKLLKGMGIKTWDVDGVAIVGVPFCGLKGIKTEHGDPLGMLILAVVEKKPDYMHPLSLGD